MYKPIDKLQHSFLDFNQPMGLHMNPDNRWIKLADRIPWDEFEVNPAFRKKLRLMQVHWFSSANAFQQIC